MIDMSTFAPPDVVQPLDFEALFSELKAEILARLPDGRRAGVGERTHHQAAAGDGLPQCCCASA